MAGRETPAAVHVQQIGGMPQFEEAVEDWQSYQERLEQFIIANSIGEDKKVATLLTLVGPKAYKLLKNLVAPAKPSEKSYED